MGEMETIERRDDGFELNGEFIRWKVTDTGKDLLLIDRFSGMPITEFFEQIEDSFDRGRAPILLALMATSVRAEHPDWSVERIVRLIMGVSLGEVTFLDGDAEEQLVPPASPDGAGASASPSGGSSPSSTTKASSKPAT